MKIRIAQIGWNYIEAAETLEDVHSGVRVPWIELDGHRFDDITDVEIALSDDSFATIDITTRVIGPVEIVYVRGGPDGDWVELGSAGMTEPAHLDGTCQVERPPERPSVISETLTRLSSIFPDYAAILMEAEIDCRAQRGERDAREAAELSRLNAGVSVIGPDGSVVHHLPHLETREGDGEGVCLGGFDESGDA